MAVITLKDSNFEQEVLASETPVLVISLPPSDWANTRSTPSSTTNRPTQSAEPLCSSVPLGAVRCTALPASVRCWACVS